MMAPGWPRDGRGRSQRSRCKQGAGKAVKITYLSVWTNWCGLSGVALQSLAPGFTYTRRPAVIIWMSSNLLSLSLSLKTRCLQISLAVFERKLSLLLDMRFFWSSARPGGDSDSLQQLSTGDVNVKLNLERQRQRQNLLRRSSYCSANADNRHTRQPRHQAANGYVYTDSLQSMRFPVLPSLPREVCSCCSKSHRIDRGATPYDPSNPRSQAPRATSPNERIMLGKVRTGGKAGFDRLYGWVDKLGAPVNRLSNKLGAEAFWPTTLDLESDKAARILRSFCSRSKPGYLCDSG